MGYILFQTIFLVPEKLHDFFLFQLAAANPPNRWRTIQLQDHQAAREGGDQGMSHTRADRGHIHQRPRGPQRPAQEYRQTNEYRHKTPKKTDTTRSRERRGAVVTCFVCHQPILGTNISSHLSSVHGYTRQLTRYLLDSEKIRRQQASDIVNVKDCLTCLRFVACSSHCHQLPECVLVDVPDYMEPDNLCEEAKIIKALCGGGQPTPRRSTETMPAAYEKLKKLFEGE